MKHYEDVKDEYIKVSDIMEYCEKVADDYRRMYVDLLKTKKMLDSNLLTAIAHFQEQELIYRYILQNIIVSMFNQDEVENNGNSKTG